MTINYAHAARFLGIDAHQDRRPCTDTAGRTLIHEADAAARLGITETDITNLAAQGALTTATPTGTPTTSELWIVETSLHDYQHQRQAS